MIGITYFGGDQVTQLIFFVQYLQMTIYTTIEAASSQCDLFLTDARNSTLIVTKFGRYVQIDLGMVPTLTDWLHAWPGMVGS